MFDEGVSGPAPRSRWSALGCGAIAAALAACGPSITLDDGETGTAGPDPVGSTSGSPPAPPGPMPSTTSAGETTTAAVTTTPPPSTSDDDTSPLDDGCQFDCDPDGGFGLECDLFAQDCPAGEKCMPWANDGGAAWNAVRCSPVARDPGQVGDPCTVEGSGVSGIDDCDVGLMCWNVDRNGTGHCEDLCTGSLAAPVCESSSDVCMIANEGVIVLCLAQCHPFLDDCPIDGESCAAHGEAWVCVPTGRTVGQGQPCEHSTACDPGLACVPPGEHTTCDGNNGCCTPYCDLDDPMADGFCQGFDPAQTCQPWYAAGQAPAGYQNLGVCMIAG